MTVSRHFYSQQNRKQLSDFYFILIKEANRLAAATHPFKPFHAIC
jgi:hypothetical protein